VVFEQRRGQNSRGAQPSNCGPNKRKKKRTETCEIRQMGDVEFSGKWVRGKREFWGRKKGTVGLEQKEELECKQRRELRG